MKKLITLLKWDIVLLHRNRLFVLAGIVAIMYIGLFYLLKPLGNLTNMLIVLIFNDPVVTGYIFAGVLWMFDRNQNTLQAVAVLPLKINQYLLSKIIVLSSLSIIVAFIMAFAMEGFHFHALLLFVSVAVSAFLFCCLGFIIGALSRTFNQFLMLSLPIFIISALPFLSLLGIGNFWHWAIIPSAGGIALLSSAFGNPSIFTDLLICAISVFFAWLSWLLAIRIVKRNML